ncbi:MAG: hypothetical protein DWQ29_13055 [Planctomycetota bacterium]|nr:MAG: hypothetical protein DWQ29_13055 [Planctomycetota bacterium]
MRLSSNYGRLKKALRQAENSSVFSTPQPLAENRKYTPQDSKESQNHGESGDSERRCVPQCAENVSWQLIRALIETCPDLSAEARQRLIEHGDEACREGVTG